MTISAKRPPLGPYTGHEAVHAALEREVSRHGQAALARLAGVTPQEVYAARPGRTRMPGPRLLRYLGFELRYAKLRRLPSDQVLADIEKQFPDPASF